MRVNEGQERLLIELAGILIPDTGSPGASSISAHLFVLKMMDECHTKEQQQKFLKGMQQLDEASHTACGHSFVEAPYKDQAALLTLTEDKKMTGDELNYFYGEMKRLSIQAYTTSKYFLTNIQVYELVPGRWHGCVPGTPNKTV